jgi:hypothetical protein
VVIILSPFELTYYLGYALHGTYWHDNFGQPMSRGCVNLSTDNAKKLFDWADPVIPSPARPKSQLRMKIPVRWSWYTNKLITLPDRAASPSALSPTPGQ